jgi:hypothetical protein
VDCYATGRFNRLRPATLVRGSSPTNSDCVGECSLWALKTLEYQTDQPSVNAISTVLRCVPSPNPN